MSLCVYNPPRPKALGVWNEGFKGVSPPYIPPATAPAPPPTSVRHFAKTLEGLVNRASKSSKTSKGLVKRGSEGQERGKVSLEGHPKAPKRGKILLKGFLEILNYENRRKVSLKGVREVATLVNVGLKGVNEVATLVKVGLRV